jgi:hypothetical protein
VEELLLVDRPDREQGRVEDRRRLALREDEVIAGWVVERAWGDP